MRWDRFFRRKQWDDERSRELDGYLEQENFASAASVYRAVVEAVIENYSRDLDYDGELSFVVARCIAGFRACLAGLKEDM